MRSVICAWCNRDSQQFEKHVPLQFVGDRNNTLGFSNDIDILFLDGFNKLDEPYKESLIELGYRLHDCSSIFADLDQKYYKLSGFGDYEKKCFLRWLVIFQYFSGESIVHYDGDIVFNENPLKLQDKIKNRTFVLQGCPALTCISDQTWFTQYIEQLNVLVNDIQGYGEKAWIEREGWELSERSKWAGIRRKVVTSDQDLVSHLIHTGRIVQDEPSEIVKNLQDYILFENPLYIHVYEPWNQNLPFKYERRANIDFINGKQVAIWHMQSNFADYLAKYIDMKNVLRLMNIDLPNDLEPSQEAYINRWIRKVGKKFLIKKRFRLDVYDFFFNQTDFSEVFNNKIWWKKDVF